MASGVVLAVIAKARCLSQSSWLVFVFQLWTIYWCFASPGRRLNVFHAWPFIIALCIVCQMPNLYSESDFSALFCVLVFVYVLMNFKHCISYCGCSRICGSVCCRISGSACGNQFPLIDHRWLTCMCGRGAQINPLWAPCLWYVRDQLQIVATPFFHFLDSRNHRMVILTYLHFMVVFFGALRKLLPHFCSNRWIYQHNRSLLDISTFRELNTCECHEEEW